MRSVEIGKSNTQILLQKIDYRLKVKNTEKMKKTDFVWKKDTIKQPRIAYFLYRRFNCKFIMRVFNLA